MSLADRFAAPPRRVSKCTFGKVLLSLPDGDRAVVESALDSAVWSNNAIRDALVSEGHEVSVWSLRTHRLGRCNCVRPE